MNMMVLAIVNSRFSHMMGDSLIPSEAFVLPCNLHGAQPVLCKTIEDGAPFSMIDYR